MAVKTKLKHQAATVKISDLVYNRGQLEGLPTNPRFIRGDSYELMRISIRTNPGFLGLRPPIVFPIEVNKYLVIAGEMRSRAAADEGHKDIPVIVLHESTPVELLREIAIKDNAHYGEWDTDELTNSWGSELSAWGVPAYWSSIAEEADSQADDGVSASNKNNVTSGGVGSKGLYKTIVLSYKPSDYKKVMAAFEAMKGTPEQIVFKLLLK